MSDNQKCFYPRSKIWLEDQDHNLVFALGRLYILEATQRSGSLHAAAKELKMGYRAIWGKISASEERLGKQLLIKRVGGSFGGGSQLTPFAETLVNDFKQINRQIEIETNSQLQKFLASKGLTDSEVI